MTTPVSHLRHLLLAVVVVAAVAAVVGPPARAATLEVTNTNDSGAGSLRQAVADANLAPGADTITFAVSGTIQLTTGIAVNGPLTIDGPDDSNLTVSGNRATRILTVGSSSVLSIRELTLADGAAGGGGGGAILNFGGTVNVANTTFLRNSAFAGGAIENANGGRLTVTGSTFSANSAFPGGAIANNASTAIIANSTLVGNSAVVGGAIYNIGFGTVDVTNTTLSGNTASAEGAAVHNQGGLTIIVRNSIFAGNGCQGPITDGGGNLDWPDSSCPGISGDPRLGALANNGGATQTLALAPGSAAIDAAVGANCPATDQRGVARPQGAGCDIGSYESDTVDETPPVISAPSNIVEDATSPDGALVSYSASAVDDVDGVVAVDCSPASGTTFPIGTTQVTCSASDAAGNEAIATFDVRVNGASEQLDDLIARVDGLGPGSSLVDKLTEARAALDAGDKAGACEKLNAFANAVQAQLGKKLTPDEAAELVSSAMRIRAVLDC